MTGVVRRFNDARGWGFIQRDDGFGDVFVHHEVIRMDGHRTLTNGARVEFTLIEGPRGPRAADVVVLAPDGV